VNPEFELQQNFCTTHLTTKFHPPSLIFQKLSCWQTNQQTIRCCWRHPPCFAMLCQWVNILISY